jgi:hypothetical protein
VSDPEGRCGLTCFYCIGCWFLGGIIFCGYVLLDIIDGSYNVSAKISWFVFFVMIRVICWSDFRMMGLAFLMTGVVYHPPYIHSKSRSLILRQTESMSSGPRPIILGYDHITLTVPPIRGMIVSAVKITEGRLSRDLSQCKIAEPEPSINCAVNWEDLGSVRQLCGR